MTGGDPEPSTPVVAVIIIAYNSGPHLQDALNALGQQTYRNVEIILFDNASTDGAARGATLPDGARYVDGEGNHGFAGGVNRAVTLTEAPLIALLNPDAFPDPDWVARLVSAAERHPDAPMFASLQLMAEEPGKLDGAGDVFHGGGLSYRGGYGAVRPPDLPEGDVFGPCGAAALYRRDAFLNAGGFDESYFCYCEDIDLAFRLRLTGASCVFVPDAIVRHIGSATEGRRSDFVMYHGARNRVWTLIKNIPLLLAAPVALYHGLVLSLLTGAALLRRDGSAAPIIRGVWHGLRRAGPAWRARRALQKRRAISSLTLARALTWSPLKLVHRAIDIRPITPS